MITSQIKTQAEIDKNNLNLTFMNFQVGNRKRSNHDTKRITFDK